MPPRTKNFCIESEADLGGTICLELRLTSKMSERGAKRGRGSDKPEEIDIGALDCIPREAAVLRMQLEKVTNENANLSRKLDQVKREKEAAVERMNDNVCAFKDAKCQGDTLRAKVKAVSTLLLEQTPEWKDELGDLCEPSKMKNIRPQTLRTPGNKQPFRVACQELLGNGDLVELCNNGGGDPMESLTALLTPDLRLLKPEVVAHLRRHMLQLVGGYLSTLPRFAQPFVVTHKALKQPWVLWYVRERASIYTAREEVASLLLDYVLADMKNYATVLDQSPAARLQSRFAARVEALVKRERKTQQGVLTAEVEAMMFDLWRKK